MHLRILKMALWLGLCGGAALCQNVTGALSGTVKDPGGAVIPGAHVVLTNQQTAKTEPATSNESGIFVFPSVLPGSYDVEISSDGFRTFHIRDIAITSAERRSLGDVVLQIGQVAERVEVAAVTTPVQTESSERAGLVSSDQLMNVAMKGRDFFGMLPTMTGVVDTASSREVVSTSGAANGVHINGGRDTSINVSVDGMSVLDTGSNGSVHTQPSMDAVSEVKVLTSNYQAEYGRNSSGSINAIIKNGTQEFHGSGYWFYRHESLNANNYFLNRSGAAKPPYRINDAGGTLGGPVYIPGRFNRNKDKLFFFFSQEYVTRRLYPGAQKVTTPTALEREGNFSQTFNEGGDLIEITDPTTGMPFPGNIIPADRINPLGQKILNFLPLPNYTDPEPDLRYASNYFTNLTGKNPRRESIIRLDYNVTEKLRAYIRGIHNKEELNYPYGSWIAGDVNYDLVNTRRRNRGMGGIVNLTYTISPSLVNEFSLGATTRGIVFNPVDKSKVARSLMGDIGQWYPAANESGAIPNVYFGEDVANPITPAIGNIPYKNENPLYTFVDNISKIAGRHTVKAGIYIERQRKDEVGSPNTRGEFHFDSDSNNPLDSGYSFSNALLGNFMSYSEGSYRPYSMYRYTQVEAYVQDNWKVAPRLTLDYGVRIYHAPPMHDIRNAVTTFDPSQYDPAAAAVLIRPGEDANGNRVGVDPRTGATFPSPYIGLFVPGSGDYAPGMAVGGLNGFPDGLFTTRAISLAPRFGFAYDPTGSGRTSIRGGFGMFYDRPQGNVAMGTNGQPPVAYTPVLYYGNLDTFLQSQGAVGPGTITAVQTGRQPLPRVMNFSLTVQRELGFGTVLDIGYVGSLGRHLLDSRNINAIPMFSRFDPANADPTTGKPLPDDFLRPYQGMGDIEVTGFGSSSNYNSLQVSVNRRMSRGLQYGVAYTFSKALGTGSADMDSVSAYFPARAWNYGPLSYDITHVLVFNYIWDLPNIGKRIDNRIISKVMADWQLAGMTSFQSGTPFTPTFSMQKSTDFTGSSESARIAVVGDPVLSKSEKSFGRNFNTDAFAPPAKGTFGNAGVGILRGPGINNWDVSLSKRIPLGNERRYLQLRAEAFNVFNHTQFSKLDTKAKFQANGTQYNNAFGSYSAARDPRKMQLSLRLMF